MIAAFRRFLNSHTPFFNRVLAVSLVFAVVACVAFGRLACIQLLEGASTAQAATDSRTTKTTLYAQRGSIVDTNGTVLAQSVERYTIIGDPLMASSFTPIDCGTSQAKATGYCHSINGQNVGETGPAAVARLLAPLLGQNAMELGAKLTGTSRYVVLAKDVEPSLKRQIDELHLSSVISAQNASQRVYPNGTLLGSLLGGVDDSGSGVAGIEQMENQALTGTDGYEIYQQGDTGQKIPGTQTQSVAPVNGSTVKLTIDRDVQWYVEKTIKEAKDQYKAAWGLAVVSDLNGNIIALADSDQYDAGSTEAKMHVSRVGTELFDPGSTGKVITMAGLLQEGLHKASDRFSVPSTITEDNQTYKDSHEHGTSKWTLAGILENSSNVGMIMASKDYSDGKRYEYLTKFGVGQSTGLNLPGESSGSLTTPDRWDRRTRNTVLFGQGYSVTALQLTNMAVTIANKGVKPSLKLVQSVTDANGHQVSTAGDAATRVVDEQVAADVLNAMESVAVSYEKTVSVPGYRVAAKTGTAEVAGPSGGLTSIVADWVGILPADNPQYVVTVVLKDPTGTYGGVTAGPVFAQIGQFLMQKYEVTPSAPRTDAIDTDW
ncbi:peptidoglycan D,D-transpeptidase FtsI family protein [Bifidobacterium sp. UBA744]|uniref:peptidoglycan D,D-transpeptidase FtsI family protein n=1 Tax=Bifidobacterium sp. UBA744 TaxID=1946112 RepID=UPI0025C52381|nr:penicillin-binding protein 2 [Bifidobacterium sp. UBA744]